MFPPRGLTLALASLLVFCGAGAAQTGSSSSPDPSASARKAIVLAEGGNCVDALPSLKKSLRQIPDRISDKDLKRKAGLAGLRCAMTLDRSDSALEFLQFLAHEFPQDPAVLYGEVHAFSDLATRASQQLGLHGASSPEAHELLAESYESQGKWDDAEKEYRKIIEQDPNFPGIHFRLGRLLLSKPNPAPSVADDAKHEFEKELATDPSNAGAEYVLGELARQSQLWDDAVAHFSRAAKLDSHFAEAFLGLGVSLMSLKRYSDAVSPLETAVKLEPGNPNAHYNLATAYTRAGRKEEGEKEFAIHQKLIKTQGGAINPAQSGAQPDK
jgi:tetratricopeptide (TPR) repeat protein